MTISDIVVNLLTIADNLDNVAQKESDGIRSIATKLESFLNNKARAFSIQRKSYDKWKNSD